MNKNISVLIVEDSAGDADLITRRLRKAGYEISHKRVETADDMLAALHGQPWDVIISDYTLPEFSAPAALALLRESGQDIPFIVFSGSVGEDKAVALLKNGAQDFVAKQNIKHLDLSVRRCLEAAMERRARRLAEITLRASEEKYRELVENANSVIIRMDREGTITFFNDYAQRLFGYSLEEALGKNVKMLVPPAESTGRNLDKMVNDFFDNPDQFVENINENVLKSGERVWISWRNKAIRDPEGNIVGNLAVGQDITERKRSERALGESERRFRALFENSLDGMMITVIDGSVLAVNAKMCEMLGMTEAEIIGVGRDGVVVQDERLTGALEERARTGKFLGELTCRRKDGSTIPVELSISVFRDFDGMIKSGQVVRDITERKNAEQALKAAHYELEKRVEQRTAEATKQVELLDLTHDAIIVTNEDGKIVFWSVGAQQTYGWTKDEAVGKTSHKLLHTEFPISLHTILDKLRHEGRWEGELVQVCKNANRIVVLSRWAIRKDEKSRLAEVMEVNRDITARKESEESLRKAGVYNRSLIEASLDPLVTIGPDGKITDANAATEQVTGRPKGTLIGTDFSDYFVDSEKARAGYQLVFKDGFVRDYELEIRHRDGQITPVRYNASVYKDQAGRVIGVFAAARDISERKEAESKLLSKSTALEELNTALKVLIEHYKTDQKELEEKIVSNIRLRVVPYVGKLKQSRLDIGQSALIEIIETSLRDISSPFSKLISSERFHLAPKEMEVAILIKEGKTTKEIAKILGLGKRTVDSYRDSIRGKLGLANKKMNLRTYLLSIYNT